MILLTAFAFTAAFVRADLSSTADDHTSFPTMAVNKDDTGLYYVNASIGTPGQVQMLRIDVAQPYLWVLSQDMQGIRLEEEGEVDNETFYDHTKSSTSKVLNNSKIRNMEFIDHISFNATTFMDSIELPSSLGTYDLEYDDQNLTVSRISNSSSLSIHNFSFFNAEYAAAYLQQGALGLGGEITQASDSDSSNYDDSFFFLDQLVQNNYINTSSYSLWFGGDVIESYAYSSALDSVAVENCGILIFGGVDRSLYTGDLVKIDTLPYYNVRTGVTSRGYPIVPLVKVDVKSKSGQVKNLTSEYFLEPVLLDTRYRYNYLPLDLIVKIATQANAYYVESLNRWLLACDVGKLGASILFDFGEVVIDVPLSDLMGPTYDSTTNGTLYFSNADQACELRFLPNSDLGFSILGGPFIKNVYLAAELQSNQVALAQAYKWPTETVSSNLGGSISVSTYANSERQSRSDSLLSTISGVKSYANPSAIISGTIPFAISKNVTAYRSLTLTDNVTKSFASNPKIMNQFTATISSDGVIFTGRSFYNTTNAAGASTVTSSTSSGASSKSSNSAGSISYMGTPVASLSALSVMVVFLTLGVIFTL